MKTIAYPRVSPAQQDTGSQRLAILEYARKHDFQIDDFVEATARGQATAKHRRLDELIGNLNRGDRLVVSELSRLGRSLGGSSPSLTASKKRASRSSRSRRKFVSKANRISRPRS